MLENHLHKSIGTHSSRASVMLDKQGVIMYCTARAKDVFAAHAHKLQDNNINDVLSYDGEWDIIIDSESIAPFIAILKGTSKRFHIEIERLSDSDEPFYVMHFETEEQSKKIDLFVQKLNDAICIKDSDGTYLDVSPSVLHIKGYRPQELIGKNYFDYIHPEERSAVKEKFDYLIQQSNSPYLLRYRFKHKEGHYIWLSTQTEVLSGNEERSTKVYTISTDISEKVEAEVQNEKIRSRYMEVFETIYEGIVYQDKDGQITSANRASQEILGLTMEQMQGRTSMHPDWRAIHEDGTDYPGETHPAMMALKTGKIIKDRIMGIYHPEKEEYVWIKVNSYPLFDKGQRKPSGAYTTFINITAEYQSTKALIESESKFRELFDNAFQFIGLTDLEGTMLDANRTGLQFLGVPKDLAIGAKLWNPPDFSITEEAREQIKDAVERAAKGQFVRFDFDVTGISGRTITLDFSLRPIFNEKNEVILLIPEGRDITKRIRLEKALQLEKELNSMQAHFAMSASHQFRTPLTIIQSNSELLTGLSNQLDKESQIKFQRYNARIKEQIERTTSLMDDILLLGKITSGSISPKYESIDLEELFVDTIENLNDALESPRISFETKGETRMVRLDKKLLTESINNLLSNALKYSDQDVLLRLRFTPEKTQITVKDKGLGINKEDQKKLFQPFFRSQEVKDFSGTGLGLSIAREYIEVQNGRISVKSAPNRGTEFKVSFNI